MNQEKWANILIGFGKTIVVLSPLAIVAYAVLGDHDNCRGDCAVGLAMLFVFYLPIIGIIFVLVLLPLMVFAVARWTADSPVQRASAFGLVPLVIVAVIGVNAYNKNASSRLEYSEMKEAYLKRAVDNPMGKADYLILAGGGGECDDACMDVLLNGIASSFSYGTVDAQTREFVIVENVKRLASLSECDEKTYATKRSLGYLQSEGIFDTCVVETAAGGKAQSGLLIGGDNWDRGRLVRPYGPQIVAVAQSVIDGKIAPEIVRWEYGSLPTSGERVGTAFRSRDFMRVLTGISTDRLSELRDLPIEQRIDRVHRVIGKVRLMLNPVFTFFRKTPGIRYLTTSVQELDATSSRKLLEIGKAICESSPKVENFEGGPSTIDCAVAYNNKVMAMFPKNAETLKLPVDQSAL